MTKLVLYAYNVSSCSWRVRSALAYKEILHEIKSVKDKKTAKFLRINPAGQIPVLDVDGNFIAESMAIIEFLEERYPKKPLFPSDIIKKAKVREICELINSGIMPLQSPRVAAHHSEDPKKQLEWQQFFINRGFSALEQILRKTSSRAHYCFENSFSAADCFLAPQVFNAQERFGVNMAPYPSISLIYHNIIKIEAIRITHPKIPIGPS